MAANANMTSDVGVLEVWVVFIECLAPELPERKDNPPFDTAGSGNSVRSRKPPARYNALGQDGPQNGVAAHQVARGMPILRVHVREHLTRILLLRGTAVNDELRTRGAFGDNQNGAR